MVRCLLTLLFVCLLLPAVTDAETRVFETRYRRAADVADAVRVLLGEQGRLAVVGDRLVVDADPQRLVDVAELLAQIDRVPRMLRVTVSQRYDSTTSETSVNMAGRVQDGSSRVVIGRPDVPPGDGATIILGDDDRLRLGAQASSHRDLRSAEQFVVTLDGSPARISIGQRLPFTERWLLLARRHGRVVESVSYESVDTGFEVVPELVGVAVRLSIRPFLSFLDPRRPEAIVFQELTTVVQVPVGGWFDLGGTMGGRDEVSREILGIGSSVEATRSTLRVRIDPQPK